MPVFCNECQTGSCMMGENKKTTEEGSYNSRSSFDEVYRMSERARNTRKQKGSAVLAVDSTSERNQEIRRCEVQSSI